MPAGVATAVGVIIAAVIGAGAAVTTTALNNSATEDAQNEARRLANIRRQDELAMGNDGKKMTKARLRLDKKRLQYERDAELFGRKERTFERGTQARESYLGKQLGMINSNDALRMQYANLFKRGGK